MVFEFNARKLWYRCEHNWQFFFQKLLQAWKYVAKDYFGLRISLIPNDIPESFCGPDDSYIQIAHFTIKEEKSLPDFSDPSSLLPIGSRQEVIVVGLECKNTKPSLTAQIACLKFENIPLNLNEQNDIQVSFWAKDPTAEEYDFTENGESKYNVMSNGQLIKPEEVKKCPRISKKDQRKVKDGSQERKLVVGHKENEFGFSINKLEVFKFPESQENRE